MRTFKDNRWIRGLWSLFSDYFGLNRKKFGFIGSHVIITPPCQGIQIMYTYMTMWGLDRMHTYLRQVQR